VLGSLLTGAGGALGGVALAGAAEADRAARLPGALTRVRSRARIAVQIST